MWGSSPLDVLPLWAVLPITIACILISEEIGYRLGRARRQRANAEKDPPVGGMVTAELGLLAFLLAFTFGIATTRFEARRQSLLDEANAIGTTYLRAAMLPASQRTEVRRLLREYVDVRLTTALEGTIEAGVGRSNELHRQLWSEAVAAAESDPRSVPIGLFVQSLNEVIDLHAQRLMVGVRSRIPTTVWSVLFAVTVLSFGTMGYHSGLTGTNRSPAIAVIAVTFAVVIWMVVDLDRPLEGVLRVSQQPMIDLEESMRDGAD